MLPLTERFKIWGKPTTCFTVLILFFLLALLLIWPMEARGEGQKASSITLHLEGQEYQLQNELLFRDGVIFAPFRELFTLLGGEVSYSVNSGRPQSRAELNGHSFILEQEIPVLYHNELILSLPAAPPLLDNTLYFPLRFMLDLAGYTVNWQETEGHVYINQHLYEVPAPREKNDYVINVLLLTGAEGLNAGSIHQHLQQSLVPNVELHVHSLNKDSLLLPDDYDLIYLDNGLAVNGTVPEELKEQLISYVKAGGILFLSHVYGEMFPVSFMGIEEMEKINNGGMDFAYPEVGQNFTGLQGVWSTFAETYNQYNGLNPDLKNAAKVDTAAVLVEREGLAYLLANEVEDGIVIWANNFLPNEQFITRFDFTPEANQSYFHYGYATANYLFRNELIKLVSKEKYGFSLQKSHGPYGRPGIAWQNHYEEINSFASKELISWIDLLASHNQIPTFSLVRGAFRWGRWQSSISVHINEGSAADPVFRGETENSFYSSGSRLEGGGDYLTFGTYPEYRTLLAQIELPHRAYPQVVDWNGNGKKDLIVGAWDGNLYLAENVGTQTDPYFKRVVKIYTADNKMLSVGSVAAPLAYDFSGNGRTDLLVGNGEGKVAIFLNRGSTTNPQLFYGGVLQADGKTLQVNNCAAPFIVDWNGNGIPDLLVGNGSGEVILFPGLASGDTPAFGPGVPLTAAGGKVETDSFAAPFAVDWNDNGRLDLLVGGGDGEIALYLRDEAGNLVSRGKLTGETYNFFGNKAIKAGHNVVPIVVDWNNNGKKDLITGQLEYGIPYPIDSPFLPNKKELHESISYAQQNHIPLIPHLFVHSFLSEAQEAREIMLHREAFAALGIPWEDDMGVNHHTWRVNRDAPLQTFRNQMSAGIWWNFGFNPPHLGSVPKEGRPFLLVHPFALAGEASPEPFLLFAPAPSSVNFPKAWDALARFDTPLTYFQHIENLLRPGTASYNNLVGTINFMNEFKDKYEYNFMTEEQMARAMLNTFFAQVSVSINGNELVMRPDYANVPANVQEYRGTLGVKLELGEALAGKEVDTSGIFFYEGEQGGYYMGLPEATAVTFVEKSSQKDKIHIVRANGPVAFRDDGKSMIFFINTRGMQEIKLFSPFSLQIRGEDLKIEKDGSYYTITHFGKPAEMTVKR